MTFVGGIVGAVAALAVVIVPFEWINPDALSDTTEAILAVLVGAIGAFVGSRVAKRLAS